MTIPGKGTYKGHFERGISLGIGKITCINGVKRRGYLHELRHDDQEIVVGL